MLSPLLVLLLVLAAYALGMFPTALLVAARDGKDPTKEGSGNPGATNVARTVGRRAGVLVLLGDVGKGVVATAIGLSLAGRTVGLICGLAAVGGHIFPVTRGFRGGKGVATALGFAAVAFPLQALVAAGAWLVVSVTTRRIALGSMALSTILPIMALVSGRPTWEAGLLAALAMMIIVRHAENISRMRSGNEQAFKVGRSPRL